MLATTTTFNFKTATTTWWANKQLFAAQNTGPRPSQSKAVFHLTGGKKGNASNCSFCQWRQSTQTIFQIYSPTAVHTHWICLGTILYKKNIKNQRWETTNMILGATMTIMEKKWPTEWIVETCVFNQVLFCLSDFSSRTLFRMKDLFISRLSFTPSFFYFFKIDSPVRSKFARDQITERSFFLKPKGPKKFTSVRESFKGRKQWTTKNDVCLRTQRLRSQASLSASFLAARRNFRDIGPSGRNLSWAIPNRTGLVFHALHEVPSAINHLIEWLIDWSNWLMH